MQPTKIALGGCTGIIVSHYVGLHGVSGLIPMIYGKLEKRKEYTNEHDSSFMINVWQWNNIEYEVLHTSYPC